MQDNPTVVFTEPEKVVIENRPVPEPGEGQVLVKTRRSLISTGTELTILAGKYLKGSAWDDYGKFPFVPGYDNVGDVLKVGPGVDESLVGKRISSFGTHSLYAAVSITETRPIRDDVPDDLATFGTISDIVYNGVRRGLPEWGESAIVYGVGLLGQMAVRCLLFAGVKPVFAVDISSERLALLPKHKRVVPINPKEANVRETVERLTKGRMADIVYEVTGAPALIPQEFEALKRQGRLVLLSSPSGPTKFFDFHDLCNAPSYTIIGAHASSSPAVATPYNQWTRPRNTELFFDMIVDGDIDMESCISHREPYTEAPELYAMLLKDRSKAMGVILQWGA
ncbi:MAG: zinc-binding alcohol dehydrogenase [Planctomycetes bacterium]|nr:zinc-binding alcohol dehydrogenase [Planctomycetota bacterium]